MIYFFSFYFGVVMSIYLTPPGYAFVINIFRKLKGLPKTFAALFPEEKNMIRSHGKWKTIGKRSISEYFTEYKCEDCGTLINVKYFAHFVYKNSKNKTCAQICMEDVMI